jgi:NitT/TauT family transport system permease protein
VRYISTIVISIIIWKLIALIVNNPILPGPFAVLITLYNIRKVVLRHILASLVRILAGVGISLFLGIIIGLVIGRVKKLDEILAPLIYLSYPVPKIAFLPIVLLFLGLGNTAKIFLIALIVFFQILVNARDAAKNIDEKLILSVKSMGANRWQLFKYVILPAALPNIFTAIRISTGTAIAVLFFTETFATFSGLGFFIMDAWTRVNYTEMFAGIFALSIVGLCLFLLIDIMERYLCDWNQ